MACCCSMLKDKLNEELMRLNNETDEQKLLIKRLRDAERRLSRDYNFSKSKCDIINNEKESLEIEMERLENELKLSKRNERATRQQLFQKEEELRHLDFHRADFDDMKREFEKMKMENEGMGDQLESIRLQPQVERAEIAERRAEELEETGRETEYFANRMEARVSHLEGQLKLSRDKAKKHHLKLIMIAECPSCSQVYNFKTDSTIPKTHPCGHTTCLKCTKTDQEGTNQCMLCGTQSSGWLPTNLILEAL